jgi:hypothetical protein
MSDEKWVQLKDFPPYEISILGRVRNGETKRILKQIKDPYGFALVHFHFQNRYFRIHRLMAETFLELPPYSYEIEHLDGNRMNNALENLRVIRHRGNSKINEVNVQLIRDLYINGWSNKAIAKKYGLNPDHVYRIIKRETWKHVL